MWATLYSLDYFEEISNEPGCLSGVGGCWIQCWCSLVDNESCRCCSLMNVVNAHAYMYVLCKHPIDIRPAGIHPINTVCVCVYTYVILWRPSTGGCFQRQACLVGTPHTTVTHVIIVRNSESHMTAICHQLSHEGPPFQCFNHTVIAMCLNRTRNAAPSKCKHLFDSVCLSALHIQRLYIVCLVGSRLGRKLHRQWYLVVWLSAYPFYQPCVRGTNAHAYIDVTSKLYLILYETLYACCNTVALK